MAEWIVLCNGGPNNKTVGKKAKSLGAACGLLETMMKSLGATIGQIESANNIDHAVEVETEEEAGG